LVFFKTCRVTVNRQTSNHFLHFLWDGCENFSFAANRSGKGEKQFSVQ